MSSLSVNPPFSIPAGANWLRQMADRRRNTNVPTAPLVVGGKREPAKKITPRLLENDECVEVVVLNKKIDDISE